MKDLDKTLTLNIFKEKYYGKRFKWKRSKSRKNY